MTKITEYTIPANVTVTKCPPANCAGPAVNAITRRALNAERRAFAKTTEQEKSS